MTTDSKTRLRYFFQLTCDTFLTDCLVRYAKCIFRYCYIMLWSLDGCIVMATDNETRLVFGICYSAWIGAVLKTGVKMRDLSWAIKEEAEMYWKGLSHPTLRPLPNMHSSFFITPPWKTQQRQESFRSYDVTVELSATSCSFESLGWSIKGCRLLYHIRIYDTWK